MFMTIFICTFSQIRVISLPAIPAHPVAVHGKLVPAGVSDLAGERESVGTAEEVLSGESQL